MNFEELLLVIDTESKENMDVSMEAFTHAVYHESFDEFAIVSEQVLNSIDNEVTEIAMEGLKSWTKDKLVSLCARLEKVCLGWADKCKKKDGRLHNMWMGLAAWFRKQMNRLKGIVTDDSKEVLLISGEVDKKQEEVKLLTQKTQDIVSNPPAPVEKKEKPTGKPQDTPNVINMDGPVKQAEPKPEPKSEPAAAPSKGKIVTNQKKGWQNNSDESRKQPEQSPQYKEYMKNAQQTAAKKNLGIIKNYQKDALNNKLKKYQEQYKQAKENNDQDRMKAAQRQIQETAAAIRKLEERKNANARKTIKTGSKSIRQNLANGIKTLTGMKKKQEQSVATASYIGLEAYTMESEMEMAMEEFVELGTGPIADSIDLHNINVAIEQALMDVIDEYPEAFSEYDDEDEFAMEGVFSKPKSSEALLAKMQKNVKKLKTIGQCDDMLRKLNDEAAKFNSSIKELQAASAQYSQDNDKKALKATCKPILSNLKKTCSLLKISSIATDPKNITQEELTKLRDVITGAKAAVKARRDEIKNGGAASESFMDEDFLFEMQCDDVAEESLIEDFDTYMDYVDAATEGVLEPNLKRSIRIQTGEVAKKLAGIVKQARKATKAKEYDEAIKLYQQAKQGYKGLMASAKKLPEYKGGTSVYSGKARDHMKQRFKLDAINWCIQRISDCDDAIEKIQNRRMKNERKAGEKEARAERKAAKAAAKAEKKAAKQNPVSESMMELEDALEALDSYDVYDEDTDYDYDDNYSDDYDDAGDTILESLLQ